MNIELPKEHEPSLHIIMRSDAPDMNPGKGMAQAAHAQSQFSLEATRLSFRDNPSNGDKLKVESYNRWLESGKTFGTTYVRKATGEDIYRFIGPGDDEDTWYGMIYDPTYPYKNWYGETYTMYYLTCAWAFEWSGMNELHRDFLYSLPLHP